MNWRTIVALVLVAALILPVASAGPVSTHSSDATGVDEPQVATATASGSSGSADGADSSASDRSNYTRLYVGDEYRHFELKPGEHDSFTVEVENGEDHAVTLTPHVVVPKVGERPVKKSWVTTTVANERVPAGGEREVTVRVDVPESAELGRYHGSVAFTNETITYPGRPPEPVHAVSFNTEVRKDPTVYVRSGRHMYSQIKAGDTYTHEIVVENTGDEAVPLNPSFESERRHHGPRDDSAKRSWFEIDAPSEVAPGETATVTVTVSPPEDASRGRYGTEFSLGLKDPARPEDRGYWQQVDLRFQVWTQPDEPFEKSFSVSEDVDNVTLKLSAGDRHRPDADTQSADFDVTWVAPNGTTYDADRVSTTNRGRVDLSGERERGRTQGAYATGGERKEFVYRVDDPATGNWSVRIMPEHTVEFGYEIVRNRDG